MAIFIAPLYDAINQFLCQKRDVGRMNNKSGIIDGWNIDGKMAENRGRNNGTIKQWGCCIYATKFMSDTVKIIVSKIEEVCVTSHAGYGC
jgi:hypothetical protein